MPHVLPQVCLASASNVGAGTLKRLANEAVLPERDLPAHRSPVDVAFDSLLLVTQIAVDASSKWNPQHGLVLSSAAVAAAEDYFRSVLTETVAVCRFCEILVRPLETRIEHVFTGSVSDAVRGLLDMESLSSRENVISWTQKITGINVKGHRSLDVALREFERVCHVRHSAVHSGGYLSYANAEMLGVPVGNWISFDSPSAVYEIIAIVTAMLRSFNQFLFEGILGRWIDENQLAGDWASDREKFTPLWRAFRSEIDIVGSRSLPEGGLRSNSYLAYRAFQNSVRARAAAG